MFSLPFRLLNSWQESDDHAEEKHVCPLTIRFVIERANAKSIFYYSRFRRVKMPFRRMYQRGHIACWSKMGPPNKHLESRIDKYRANHVRK